MSESPKSPIWKAVHDIQDRLEAIEKTIDEALKSKAADPVPAVTETKPETTEVFPVPAEYRRLVDTELNKEFGIKVIPRNDSPQFEILITVPNKYAQMSDEYRKLYGSDIRTRVLSFADAANGVKQFCELVFKSFNPTIQAMIVSDRVNA